MSRSEHAPLDPLPPIASVRLEDLPDETEPKAVTVSGRRVGRPSLLTKQLLREVLPKICEDLRLGMPLVPACFRAGYKPRAIQNWIAEGLQDDADPLHQYFAVSIMQARSDFMRRSLARLQLTRSGKSGDKREGVWTIDAWLLERSFPQHFGQHRDRPAEMGSYVGPSFADVDPARQGNARFAALDDIDL